MSAERPRTPVAGADETPAVATGDRRDEVRFEPDPDQLVVASHLVRPTKPLAPHDHAPGALAAAERDTPPVEDVKIAPEAPSVWDARPTNDSHS